MTQYDIKIIIQLHAVTCPGVWLCQKGKVELSMNTMGYNFRTDSIQPRFPIFCHKTFKMEGHYNNVDNIAIIEKNIVNECINFTLWQNGQRLAHYSGKLGTILQCSNEFINKQNQKLNRLVDTSVFMICSKSFPGIISPRIKLSAQCNISEICRKCSIDNLGLKKNLNKKSKYHYKQMEKHDHSTSKLHHQKPVCHAKGILSDDCFVNPYKMLCESPIKQQQSAQLMHRSYSMDAGLNSNRNQEFFLQDYLHPTTHHNYNKLRDLECGHQYNEHEHNMNNEMVQHHQQQHHCLSSTTINDSMEPLEVIHSKQCQICYNYRQYFNLLSDC